MVLEHKLGLIPIRNDALIYVEDPNPPPDFKPQQRADYERQPTGYAVGFSNKSGFYLDFFHYREGAIRDLVSQMKVGSYFFEYTYFNHEFMAKTPDGRVVAMRKVGSVQVIDCPEKIRGGVAIRMLPHGAIDVENRYAVYVDRADDGEGKCAADEIAVEYTAHKQMVKSKEACHNFEIVEEALQLPGGKGKLKIIRDVLVGSSLSLAGSVLAN